MKLVVALDLPSVAENYALLAKLLELPADQRDQLAFKVGLSTFIADGHNFLNWLRGHLPNNEIILDLKLHDIPNTMAEAAVRIAELGVTMFTIHAAAGTKAIREVCHRINSPACEKHRPKVLAVTVLTSMNDEDCKGVYGEGTAARVKSFICEAHRVGENGIVCSPKELQLVQEVEDSTRPYSKIIRFVPGVELEPRKDDQARKGTLKDCIEGGADYVVIGRPIYTNADPASVVVKILNKITDLKRLRAEYENAGGW